MKQQTYRDQGLQLLLGALLLSLVGSSLSTMYEQRRLEKSIKNMHDQFKQIKLKLFIFFNEILTNSQALHFSLFQ